MHVCVYIYTWRSRHLRHSIGNGVSRWSSISNPGFVLSVFNRFMRVSPSPSKGSSKFLFFHKFSNSDLAFPISGESEALKETIDKMLKRIDGLYRQKFGSWEVRKYGQLNVVRLRIGEGLECEGFFNTINNYNFHSWVTETTLTRKAFNTPSSPIQLNSACLS